MLLLKLMFMQQKAIFPVSRIDVLEVLGNFFLIFSG